MTDIEPRRSGRKTKGQHTRNSDAQELVQTPTAPKTPARRKSAAVKQPTPAASSPAVSTSPPGSEDEDSDDDDPNAQIRCACGATKEQKGDTRMMVQCEGCKVWQHCECLELDEDELDDDKDYYCEVCKPENHEEFLAKVEKGEKPWEAAKKNRRKRKGRKSTAKGRRGKAVQPKKKGGKKEELEPEAEEESPQQAEPEAQPEPEAEQEEEQPEAHPEVEPAAEEDAVEAAEEPKGEEMEEMEEDTKEGVGVTQDEDHKQMNGNDEQMNVNDEQMNGNDEHMDGNDEQDDVKVETKAEHDPQPIEQATPEQNADEEDVTMGETEDVKEIKLGGSAPTEEVAPSTMPPPEIPQPQPQHEVSQEAAVKDEEMADAPERCSSPTPITPTTPIITRHRESKRKAAMPEPQRALRRKTTHDSDGDYHSESDMPQPLRRASASSSTKHEGPKELPVKPSPRRASIPKPVPKKPSGPDDISIQSEAVEKVDDLRNNARRNIVNFLAPIVKKLVQQNEGILTEEQKHQEYPEKLALEIERHLYLALWNQHCQPTQQYKLKARGIGLNLPKNPVLQSRLFKGEVTPEALVQMKPEEMASEEFQLMAEQVRRESEIQNTIVTEETGPRIRRTHKGEEIVEDDNERVTSNDEPIYSAARSDHVMEEAPSPRSRAVSQAAEDYPMSPPHLKTEDSNHSAHAGSAPQTPQTPLSARTPRGGQFSIEGVWSNVNAPEGPKTPGPRQAPHMLSLRTATQPNSAIDADIDKLLAEEDHDMDNETPPYSPSELTFTDTALPVWRGRVSMISVSNFPARAHFLGGPMDAQQKIPLTELLGGTMLIDGRIAIDRATEYLCGQKFSSTNEIIVLSIEPEDHTEPAAGSEFNKLFQYFQKKERYGVVGKPPHKAIKDCYLVPIDVRDDMPDFFETLPKHSLEQAPRKKRVFAVVIVLSKAALEEERRKNIEASKPRSNSETQSPMLRTPVQQQQQQSPIPHQAPIHHHHPHQPQQQKPFSGAKPLPDYPVQPHYAYQQPYAQQQQQQQQHPYATPPPIPVNNHHPHTHNNNNGYHHPYYQPQPPPQQPVHHHHQQQVPIPTPPPQPVKQFNFTPWKELQDALPQLTVEQVNIINRIVARNPTAQHDPALLARMIKEEGG